MSNGADLPDDVDALKAMLLEARVSGHRRVLALSRLVCGRRNFLPQRELVRRDWPNIRRATLTAS